MAKGFKHGTSSKTENPLKFAVVAYASEVDLNTATPEDTTITTIGVVTTNPINGWYFSSVQPENMKEGEVWFATDKSSSTEFNALNNNNIMVYPVGAKQMVSGELKDVTAKTYLKDVWVAWAPPTVYLMKSGEGNPNDFEYDVYSQEYGSCTITAEKISLSVAKLLSFQKKETVDLTRYKTVHFNVDCTRTSAGQFHLCASKKSLLGDYLTDLSAPAMVAPEATGVQELKLDVTNLSGNYYIGGKTSYRNNGGGWTDMIIYDIWMD